MHTIYFISFLYILFWDETSIYDINRYAFLHIYESVKNQTNLDIYKRITVMISSDNHVYIKSRHKRYHNHIIAYF